MVLLKFHAGDGDTKRVIINGMRPSPLSIKKDSSHIAKKQQQPTIIYASSPKIIHVKPREFMALVQRLTGKETAPKEQVKKEVKKEESFHELLKDIPLYTPNSASFLLTSSSPGHMFRYSDMLSPLPNATSFYSSTVFEANKKGLH